jgi:Stress up-regulated Nod 19
MMHACSVPALPVGLLYEPSERNRARGDRTLRRLVGSAVAATALIVLACLVPPAALAREQTFKLRYGPVALAPGELEARVRSVKPPPLAGLITSIHAYVTDRRGHRLASTQVMLHHAVFGRVISPRYDSDCREMRDSEPFYATGEEDEALRLPRGYGIRTHPGSEWRVRWMLMNHTDRAQQAFINYDVRVDSSSLVVPVVPLWLRVVACREEYFDVPGGGGAGSVLTKSRTLPARIGGRIVAATGHLHAGAVSLSLSQPACGGRQLIASRPLYTTGALTPTDGPVHVTSFASPVGISVAAGEPLTLSVAYDNSIRRNDVMGTLHVYLRPSRGTQQTCKPV